MSKPANLPPREPIPRLLLITDAQGMQRVICDWPLDVHHVRIPLAFPDQESQAEFVAEALLPSRFRDLWMRADCQRAVISTNLLPASVLKAAVDTQTVVDSLNQLREVAG